MDKLAIQSALNLETNSLIDEIVAFDEIDSTNLEAIRQIKAGKSGIRLIVADAQSAGRGRRGRQWLSPAGGIYMSLSRAFERGPNALQALSLVTALSVMLAAQRLGAAELQLKWPNDVLAANKKLAGVLLELHTGSQQIHVVFGIGMNLALSPDSLAAIDRPVTDLATITGEKPDGAGVIAEIASQLLNNIQKFEDDGFAPFQELWNVHDRYLDRDIVIQSGSTRTIGKSLGVDANGALILQSAGGTELIGGGEIFPSLRAASEAAD